MRRPRLHGCDFQAPARLKIQGRLWGEWLLLRCFLSSYSIIQFLFSSYYSSYSSSYSRFCWQGHDNQAFCESIKKSKNILSFFATCRSLVLVALPAKSRIRAGSKNWELNKNWTKLRKRSKKQALLPHLRSGASVRSHE